MKLNKDEFENALQQDRQVLLQHPRADKIFGPGVNLMQEEPVRIEGPP